MSFPQYPTCKDSGVEWLGEIPEHWVAVPIKRLGRLKGGAGFPHENQGVEGEELSFHKVNALAQADDEGFLGESDNTITRETAEQLGAFVFPARTIIFAKVGAALLLGRIRLLNRDACIDNNMMGLVVHHDLCVGFVRYAMSLVRFDLIANPGAVPSLNERQIGSFHLPTPPVAEQSLIAAFLDRETAKIDALVAEQERLIELLKRKRKAVISHAVTKGLNPDAPMKASGIEWLGDVPAHWEVKRLKFVTESVKAGPFGSSLTKDVYTTAGYRVYGQEQVIPNDFTIGDYFIEPKKYEELTQYSVTPGDVLISCVGTFGKVAIVPKNIEPGIINPRLIRLRCTRAIKAEYLAEVMRSNVTFDQFASFTRGGTMDVINIGTLNEIFLALPPLVEQVQLLDFVFRNTSRFDALILEAQRGINLLQERRAALISAAVTGRIDARGLANPEAA